MPNFIHELGQQAATGGLGAIMGMMMGSYNDDRQYDQQANLQELQIQGNKRMIDYQMMKQLEMWKNTSYAAQKEQMIKAGINPALMYGMSGGGGQSTGNATGNVTGANAPVGGGEIGMGIQSAMQLALLRAQKENIEADTANKKADVPVKESQVPNIQASTENTKANTALTQVKTEIANIEKEIQGRSKEDQITAIQHGALKIIDEAKSALAKANIDEATWETEIKKIETDLVGMYLRNTLTGAQTLKTTEETRAIAEQLIQGWHKLNIDFANAATHRKSYELQKWIHNISDSTKLTVETIKGVVQALLLKFK